MSRALDETGFAASYTAAPRLAWLNVVLVVAIGAAGALSLWLEGYVPRIDWGFGCFGIVMFACAAWVAASAISTGRLLRLAAVAGVGGYATQYVGATLGGIWHYPPPAHSFYFVPAMFMIASLVAYGLTTSVLAPRWRGSLPALPRWANLLVVAVLIGVVILTSQPYRAGQGALFWLYYGALAVAAVRCALRVDMATLLALTVSAVLVGVCSESLGARSGLWTFDDEPGWLPPVWLILGSWPIEIMMHFSLWVPRREDVPRRRVTHAPSSDARLTSASTIT